MSQAEQSLSPIQVLYLIRRKEAWYQLSDEEKNVVGQQTLAATIQAGGKRLVMSDAVWSAAGDTEFFEVTEFPDLVAVQRRIDLYEQVRIFRYYQITSILGTSLPQVCHDDL